MMSRQQSSSTTRPSIGHQFQVQHQQTGAENGNHQPFWQAQSSASHGEMDARVQQKAWEMQRQKERLKQLHVGNNGKAPMSLNAAAMIDSFLHANVVASTAQQHSSTVGAHFVNGSVPAPVPNHASSSNTATSTSHWTTGVPQQSLYGSQSVHPAIFGDDTKIPECYKRALVACGGDPSPTNGCMPNTALVYSLLVASRLPRDTLGTVWSLANRTLPGQLTNQEFYAALALVALAQSNRPLTPNVLSELTTSLPVPVFHGTTFDSSSTIVAASANDSSGSSSGALSLSTASYSPQAGDGSTTLHHNDNNTHATVSPAASYIISTMPLDSTPTPPTDYRSFSPSLQPKDGERPANSIADNDSSAPSSDPYAAFKQLSSATNGPDVTSSSSVNASTNNHKIPPLADNMGPVHQPGLLLPSNNAPTDGGILQPIRADTAPNDKYAAMRDQLETTTDDEDRTNYLHVWLKCMESVLGLLKFACDLLGGVRNSDVTRQVLSTEMGTDYLHSLALAYGVVSRIRFSLKTTTYQTNDRVLKLVSDVEKQWSILNGFAVGFEHLLPKISHSEFAAGFLTRDGSSSSVEAEACGICLMKVDQDSQYQQMVLGRLDYARQPYHPQCANLWINNVQSLLPALRLPELL